MSNGLVGLFAGIGAAGWVYAKMSRRTGGNTQTALIVAGVAGIFAFGIVFLLLGAFFKS